MKTELSDKLPDLPSVPGVYVFKNEHGRVLYVGKARSLKHRVRSYFQQGRSDTRMHVDTMLPEIASIETVVVTSEKEAFLLENQLIKELKPKYNIKLKDDKEYLSIRLDPKEPWPKLTLIRKPKTDGAWHYGPYDSAVKARKTLKRVNQYFKLRTCQDREFKSRTRPCLQYQIKRCDAPCVFEVPKEQYQEQVKLVDYFLDGKKEALTAQLQTHMQKASLELRFEDAARIRDQMNAIAKVIEEQVVAVHSDINQDAIGLFHDADLTQVIVLRLREGRIRNVHRFLLKKVMLNDEALLREILRDFYADKDAEEIPDEVLLPGLIDEAPLFAEWLRDKRGRTVHLHVPERGLKHDLIALAEKNAEHAFLEHRTKERELGSRLDSLQQFCRLPMRPSRVECLDISHTAGSDTVAAFAVMQDGVLEPRQTLEFKIATVTDGNDFGAMHEALSRRLERGKKQNNSDETSYFALPDLLVMDGGKGQLAIALEVLAALNLQQIPVIALAKEKGEKEERIFLPGQKNHIPLDPRHPVYTLLIPLRDATHDAANRYRKRLEKRRQLKSGLEDIPGIGKKTAKLLLSTLGSLAKIKEASVDELKAAGISSKQAEVIWKHYHA